MTKEGTSQGILCRRRVALLDTDRHRTVATLLHIRLDLLKEVEDIITTQCLADHRPHLIPVDHLTRVALRTFINDLVPTRMLSKT